MDRWIAAVCTTDTTRPNIETNRTVQILSAFGRRVLPTVQSMSHSFAGSEAAGRILSTSAAHFAFPVAQRFRGSQSARN
jgi:hypothetical protein